MEATHDDTTVVAQPPWLTPAFTAVGAAGGWLVRLLAQWLVGLPWAPLQGPAELLTSVPEPWLTVGTVVAGALLGLGLGFVAHHESLRVAVSGDGVRLTLKGESEDFPREAVGGVFRDGERLVLLDRDGGELAREECDLAADRLATAFTAHGYPWTEGDPHAAEFRRWVPESPGLPEGADALLKARERALKAKDGADTRELRRELARLGVVVREERHRQYWRTAPPRR
ncbi:hypothetical protein WDH52_16275 [Streptomyces sp. TRM70308]|uniref:YqeB family protein n=1 Tax=Streptomyces sp. TRM70308 TaxID=3131932 RepID=UPI003D012706